MYPKVLCVLPRTKKNWWNAFERNRLACGTTFWIFIGGYTVSTKFGPLPAKRRNGITLKRTDYTLRQSKPLSNYTKKPVIEPGNNERMGIFSGNIHGNTKGILQFATKKAPSMMKGHGSNFRMDQRKNRWLFDVPNTSLLIGLKVWRSCGININTGFILL